jgi:hypothetical protein
VIPVTAIRTPISQGLIILFGMLCLSCKQKAGTENPHSGDPEQEILVKRREDGTLSSVNQIDEMGIVHGIRVTYYPDGKTVYSKLTLNHGIKHGPFIRYYRNGQIFEHSAYRDGKKHGPARKYYKNGSLLAEFAYDNGILLPGLKEYHRDGTLVTDYPEILFRVEDHLADRNRVDLHMYPMPDRPGIKYYVKQSSNGQESRVYLISENGSASMQFYVSPGDTLHKKVEIIAEIPTELGNTMVRELGYDLTVAHPH